jgi:hypothetical protein
MLDTISTLEIPQISRPTVRQVRGQFLAKNKMTPRERARLAAEILTGRADVVDHTKPQAAFLCRVSVSSIKNVGKAAARKPVSDVLLDIWRRASPEQRREFIRAAGTEAVWNELNSAL